MATMWGTTTSGRECFGTDGAAGTTVDIKDARRVAADAMYRAILPDGEIKCDRYEQSDHGVDLFDDADEHLAFVPYHNLIGLLDDEMDVDEDDERSFM